ncbi:DNA-binding MarR family transcriptional regulator [Lachnospiraceae bacterium PF1-21]|uniref:MarR family transcriptional regulator n=1 Tax=Ohessyouella blattaphilus TaxID=2949333 RepID=A0ABT1EHK7_9FIRM|nr:MarR family transcriptional regulator [Ohessyouella blattaphilus]MCP1110183.1 MarR family transcriptional regulator [Ohessyouella blattaphilus]MCR8563577.1 MarR family transcriptional regulator [Ohessyouella blattaphilus]
MKKGNSAPFFMLITTLGHLLGYRSMKRMNTIEAKPGQARILYSLRAAGQLSQAELAKRSCITAPSMTVALKKLEHMGLVEKTLDSEDKRIVRISITEKGLAQVQKIEDAIQGMDQLICENMTAEEKIIFRRLLLQVISNLEDNEEKDVYEVMREVHLDMHEHKSPHRKRGKQVDE